MCGLIWVIQLVHYPTFNFVDEPKFSAFERFHTTRITLIVVPIMIIELLSAVVLVMYAQNLIFITNLIFVLVIWLVTFTFSVPFHTALCKAKNDQLIQKLILTNWLRTILWTIKSILLIFWFKNILP